MTEPLRMRNVLFATDFSDASRAAGESAAAFARHFGARLHVLHVVPPVTDPTPAPGALQAVAAELEPGLTVVTAIASGRVARRIVDYAHRNAIDLIVMGTHGRTGVSYALLGSVAEAVTSRSPSRPYGAGFVVGHGPARDQGGGCRGADHVPGVRSRDAGRADLRGVPREDPR
jgi:universal stress protein A